MIDAPATCRECGARLPGGPLAGLCPVCLLGASVNEADWVDTAAPALPQTVGRMPFWRFGRYQVIEEISRGGAGVVFRARDEGLQRDVALKILRAGSLASRDDTRRLFLEARAAARLNHPGIVPVFEVSGPDEAQPFLAMSFIPGGTLAQRLKRGALPAMEVARLLATVSRAVHHAHQHGIIHRDLKPGNILFDADGSPLVADFGLARLLDEDEALTQTHAVLGTPAYLSPEQAAGRSGELTTSTDVYALGAILYECLVGRAPFSENEFPKLLRQIAEAPPVPPRQINAGVPADLETICLKCLEKEPAKRYGTAHELADDLERFLGDEPIQARPVSPVEKAWRWCHRKRALATSLLLILILLAIVIVGSPLAVFYIDRERRRAEAGERIARQKQYLSDMNLAQKAWEEGNLRRAMELLNNHSPQPGQTDRRGFEWRYLWNLCRDVSLSTQPLPAGDPVMAFANTPAHSFVVAACQTTVRVLDAATGLMLDQFSYPNSQTANANHLAALAANSTNLLAIHRTGGVVGLRDLAAKKWFMSFQPFDRNLSTIALSPDGRMLAAGEGRRFALWDVSMRSAESAHVLWSHELERDCRNLIFSPDGQTLLVERQNPGDDSLTAWEVETGRKLAGFPPAPAGYIWALAFSPDGRLLAHSGVSTRITVLDFAQRTVKWSLDGHLGTVTSLTISADGERLLSSGLDGTIRQWDLRTGQRTGLWRDPRENGVSWAGFAPGGHSLLSHNGSELKIWSTDEESPAITIENEQNMGGPAPAISPDGKWLVTTGPTPTTTTSDHAKLWELRTRRHALDLAHGDIGVSGPAFSPDGKLFALGSQGRVIGLWETAAWEGTSVRALPVTYLTNDFVPGSLAFSSDGTILAAAGLFSDLGVPSEATNRLAFWEVGSWRKLDLRPGAGAGRNTNAAAATVAFSRDGRWFALGSRDGWARLWDFSARRLVKEFQVYPPNPRNYSVLGVVVAFSRDGRWLAAHALGDRYVSLLDLAHRDQPTRRLDTDSHYRVWSLAFAPDGKSLATGGNDGLIRLWNLETFEAALALRHGPGHSLFITFAPDGNLLVSQESQGRLKLWPATPVTAIPQLHPAEDHGDWK